MSVVIQVSYEHDSELLEVTERLEDLPLTISKQYETGRFKRCYLRSKNRKSSETADNLTSSKSTPA